LGGAHCTREYAAGDCRLNKHVNAALADPTFKAKMIDLGGAPFANIPAGFGGFIAEYTDKWPKVIHVANIKPE
jgi:tripartite-type tricarboxylate transporter receptor subunit TctC